MQGFEPYVSSIEEIASAALISPSVVQDGFRSSALLDGQAGIKLRETVPLTYRRERGAFFSSSDLRGAALTPWPNASASQGPVVDPAVGAGDLLIAVAQRLPFDKDLAKTLRAWGSVLHGRDIEPSFVRLARARLVLLAVSRGATSISDNGARLDGVFPEIKVGDGLDLLNQGWKRGHIIMNPPFTYHRVPAGVEWASGRTSLAATFLAAAVQHSMPGTRLTAILPDVIRAGTRYDRLRSLIGKRLRVSSIERYGRFDAWTDVDVFVLRAVINDSTSAASSVQWWRPTTGQQVKDSFDVRVGPVVPHRDPESDLTHPYLRARRIPLGGEFDAAQAEKRGFQTRLFTPPFVVVRRTSRPEDKARGAGTVINGTKGVLVENHLIVLKPRDGSLEACRRVVDLLDSAQAREWLDERIRCRHLTVGALREMPWLNT